MARVTTEDCTTSIPNRFQLVIYACNRARDLTSGTEAEVTIDNDKNTVVALREIASENVKVSDLTESAVYKLRKHFEEVDDGSEDDDEVGDDFENLYKGEISKSGVPILPSKRARKIPEKIQVTKEDLDELKNSQENQSIAENTENTAEEQSEDVSIEDLKEVEATDDQENKDI